MQEKSELIVELFSGYANGIITDEECCDMIDLLNQKNKGYEKVSKRRIERKVRKNTNRNKRNVLRPKNF